jgi:hypothetical protein
LGVVLVKGQKKEKDDTARYVLLVMLLFIQLFSWQVQGGWSLHISLYATLAAAACGSAAPFLQVALGEAQAVTVSDTPVVRSPL